MGEPSVGMTTQACWRKLAPYTTQEFLPVMKSVDLNNMSATQVEAAEVTSLPDSVERCCHHGGGWITAINTTGWLVSAYTERLAWQDGNRRRDPRVAGVVVLAITALVINV